MDDEEPRLVIRFAADPRHRAVLVKRGEETINLASAARIKSLTFTGDMAGGTSPHAHCELTLQAGRIEIDASASIVAAALDQPVKEDGPMTVGTRLPKCSHCGHVQKEKPD